MKMGREILTFGGIEIKKYKSPIFMKDVDIENVLASVVYNIGVSGHLTPQYIFGYGGIRILCPLGVLGYFRLYIKFLCIKLF